MKVDEVMKNPETRKRVETTLQRNRDFQVKKNNNSKVKEATLTISAAVSHGSYSARTENFIHNSWILDSGSDTHLCNKSMKG